MSLKRGACIMDESSHGKEKTFSATRIRTCILVHNLAGYLRVLSFFNELEIRRFSARNWPIMRWIVYGY